MEQKEIVNTPGTVAWPLKTQNSSVGGTAERLRCYNVGEISESDDWGQREGVA